MQISFYQNIDNVIQNNNEKVALYKKALADSTEYQQQVFVYLNLLDELQSSRIKLKKSPIF
jgi:hypothetical protein